MKQIEHFVYIVATIASWSYEHKPCIWAHIHCQ